MRREHEVAPGKFLFFKISEGHGKFKLKLSPNNTPAYKCLPFQTTSLSASKGFLEFDVTDPPITQIVRMPKQRVFLGLFLQWWHCDDDNDDDTAMMTMMPLRRRFLRWETGEKCSDAADTSSLWRVNLRFLYRNHEFALHKAISSHVVQ